jgi:ABC-type arginine transport system permease subunit
MENSASIPKRNLKIPQCVIKLYADVTIFSSNIHPLWMLILNIFQYFVRSKPNLVHIYIHFYANNSTLPLIIVEQFPCKSLLFPHLSKQRLHSAD